MTVALSALNFRDLGGLPVGNDARVRLGLIFRSEGPASFFDAHRAELGDLGFRAVCDLRSAGERESAPNDWCGPECRVINLDMNTDLRAQGEDMWEMLKADASTANARKVMTQNYRLMPGALMAHWPVLIDVFLGGAVPMMVHCTAGKDRTGVAVALLLEMIGVSRDTIMADYEKSDVFGQNMRIAGSIEDGFMKSFGFVPDAPVIAMLIGTERDFLAAALDEVNAGWGSTHDYFAAAGVDTSVQRAVRNMMLEQV